MAEQLGDAVLTVRADTQALDAGLARARQNVERTGKAAEQAFTGAGAAIKGVALNLAALAGVVGVGALVQQIGSVGKESERSKIQLNALSGAYGESTRAAESASRIQKILNISALEARQNFSQLYAALRGTGIGVNELEVLFVGLSKAARLSGASTAEASGALLQLRQGLSAGVLQGDELRSVLENLPVFAQAVAREMGVNVGQLRKLGSEGKITSDIVFNAAKNLAGATVPGKASAEDLTTAFTNLKEASAEAFGPVATQAIRNTTAAIEAFGRLVKTNQKPLTELLQTTAATSKVLIPLAVGIGAVNVALGIWALRAKAVAQAQVLVQALSGPQGLALLALGIGAAAAANKVLESSFAGVSDTLKQSKEEAALASKEFDKVAKGASLNKNPNAITPKIQEQLNLQLKANQAALEYKNLLEQQAAAAARPGLTELGQVRLENELKQNEKIRKIEADRLQLKAELNKPSAGGQQDDPQRRQSVIALQEKIKTGETELAILRIQNRQAEVEASRAQGDRLRQIQLENEAADQRLSLTVKQTALEREALRTGVEVSRTAQLRLQLQDQIATATRQERAAREALATELSRPKEDQSRLAVADLVVKLNTANNNVRQAYADAGKSLVENARSAAGSLKNAQESIQGSLRGGFQFLSGRLQREQLERARAAIQPLVDRGVIRTGLDISSPEKLFGLASFAESFTKAQANLDQALAENAKATAELVAKNWNVVVQLPQQQTVLALSNT